VELLCCEVEPYQIRNPNLLKDCRLLEQLEDDKGGSNGLKIMHHRGSKQLIVV
jgi:hypothetical protein